MMKLKIYNVVGLKRAIGMFASAAVLLSAGCADENLPGGDDWHSQPKDEAIEFKDSSVLAILIEHGADTNGDGAISYAEAAAVKSIETWFSQSDIQSFDELEYFTGVTFIDDYAFSGCSSLTSITIPDRVTKIGEYAFAYCRSLTSITIPDNVLSIGGGAFAYCNNLERFEGKFVSFDSRYLVIDGVLTAFAPAGLTGYSIPDNVTAIGDSAFADCVYLTSITIPGCVTEIGGHAFDNCGSLTSIAIPHSITAIGESAFACCNNLERFEGKFASSDSRCLIIDGVLAAFAPAGLTEYAIPDGVTEIGEDVFAAYVGFSNLTSITIPDSVTSIGGGAFAGCCSLTSIAIPDSVTSIGNNAFWHCCSLTSITIPENVSSIGDFAFSGCRSLTSIIIPENVSTIGLCAFSQCDNLQEVYCKPVTPPTIGEYAFFKSESYPASNIYVPTSSVEAYKAAEGWNEYADMIVGYDF